MLLKSKKLKKKADEAKLSLTLRKCLPTDAPSSDQFAPNAQSATADDNDEDDDEVSHNLVDILTLKEKSNQKGYLRKSE